MLRRPIHSTTISGNRASNARWVSASSFGAMVAIGILLPSWAAEAPRASSSPEISQIVADYTSARMRELVLEKLKTSQGPNNVEGRKALRFLVDLRNDDLTMWLLTRRAKRWSAREVLEEKGLSVKHAYLISRCMLALALPPPSEWPPGGEEQLDQQGCVYGLSTAFCRCIGLKVAGPRDYTRAPLRKWLIGAVEAALKQSENDDVARLRLELLRLQIKNMKVR